MPHLNPLSSAPKTISVAANNIQNSLTKFSIAIISLEMILYQKSVKNALKTVTVCQVNSSVNLLFFPNSRFRNKFGMTCFFLSC